MAASCPLVHDALAKVETMDRFLLDLQAAVATSEQYVVSITENMPIADSRVDSGTVCHSFFGIDTIHKFFTVEKVGYNFFDTRHPRRPTHHDDFIYFRFIKLRVPQYLFDWFDCKAK